MLSLYTLVAASQAVADTLHKEILVQKIQNLSQMSTEELTSMVIKWVLNLSARVLIAVAIFFIGRWIIRYLKRILRRMMIGRGFAQKLPAESGQHYAHPIPDYRHYRRLGDRHHIVRCNLCIGRFSHRYGTERHIAKFCGWCNDSYFQTVPGR